MVLTHFTLSNLFFFLIKNIQICYLITNQTVYDKLVLAIVEVCNKNQNEYLRPKILAEKGWFEISELDKERIQVGDLGGRFLGYHYSLSCLPDQIQGFRPNSIIFVFICGYYGNHRISINV